MNKKHDYTIAQRSRKRRARLKAEREAAKLIADQALAAAQRLADEQHKADLAAKRAAKGLPPIKTATGRKRATRERRKREAAEEAERLNSRPVTEIVNLQI